MNAVAVQMSSVSMNTDSICTRPCLAGWETDAVAAAFGAEPIPASFEYRPRFTPYMMQLPEKPPIQISYTTPEEIGFAWEEDGLELEVAEVLPVEEISLAPDPDADASAPEAPADSDDTNGTEAAAASDAPAQAPHTEAPAAAQPAAPAVPTLPQTGTTGWAAALAAFGTGLLAAGQRLTCKAKRS